MDILKIIKKEVFDIKSDLDDGKDYLSIFSVYDNYSFKMIKYIESKRKSVLESLFDCIADNIKNNLPANELITVRIDEQLKNYIITKLTIIEKKQIIIDISNESKEIKFLFDCVRIYSSLPNDHKTDIFNTWHAYEKYENIRQSFDKLTSAKLYNLFCEIKSKLENKETHETILKTIGRHHDITRYILCYINKIEKFIWRENQRLGWQKAIDSNFINGIHSQATGSGKSLIALKEINEYNKKYPTHNVMWICERKDIPQKLFFQDIVKCVNGLITGKPHKKNYKFWQINDIIDMSKFHVIEHIYNKDPKWIQNINTYTGKKPIFLIINRAFMTTKSHKKNIQYKYQEIVKMPKFIIIDECHSSMSNETYNLLLYLKNNCKSKIHGFSATPYRTGKSYTNININIDTDVDINTNENEQKLLNIFHEQEDKSKLNILSFFNLKDAIEEGIILEPVFHWYYMDKDDAKTNNTTDITSILNVIKSVLKKCKYKKCIVWCGTIALAEEWKTIFDEHKHKYAILKNLCSYIDHSKTNNNDYDNFYNEKDNCIMFCANKFREGSDIPYLSCCVFLDKVINRGLIPFIQCIGRVLRKDIENEKKNGIILDGCVKEDNESNVKSVVLKILKYYEYLYNMGDNKNIDTYNQTKSSIDVNPDTKIISIKLKNNKTLKIDVAKLQLSSLEWSKIIPTFTEQLKTKFVLSDYQEYKVIQRYCQDINIKDKYHYEQEYKNHQELCIEETQMLDIKSKYPNYFKNWYDFLGIDTNDFIQKLDDWRQECKSRDITNFKQYMKLCQNYKQFPNMPEEFYEGFTNIESELHNKNKSVFL